MLMVANIAHQLAILLKIHLTFGGRSFLKLKAGEEI